LQRKRIVGIGWFNSRMWDLATAGIGADAERGDGECSGRGVGNDALDDLRLRAYQRPRIDGKDDDHNVSAGEALLENHVRVVGDESLETGLLGGVE